MAGLNYPKDHGQGDSSIPNGPYITFRKVPRIAVRQRDTAKYPGKIKRRGDWYYREGEPQDYHMPVNAMQYDLIHGSGQAAAQQMVLKREGRGHSVVGFGNFPDESHKQKSDQHYRKFGQWLMTASALKMSNPDSAIRKQIETDVRKKLEAEMRGEKDGAKKAKFTKNSKGKASVEDASTGDSGQELA